MQLSDVCLVRSGFSARQRLEPVADGTLALHQGCITSAGTLDPTAIIRVKTRPGFSPHVVQEGDVLFRSRGTAVSAWAVDETLNEPAIALLPLYILRPTVGLLDGGYLAWLLARPYAQAYFAREAVGTNLQMIKRPTIGSFPITLPTLDVQTAVASAAHLAARELELTTQLAAQRHTLLTLHLDARTKSTDYDRNTK